MSEEPSTWGDPVVSDGPESWGDPVVSDDSPDSWGDPVIRGPVELAQARSRLKKEKSALKSEGDPSILAQLPSAVAETGKEAATAVARGAATAAGKTLSGAARALDIVGTSPALTVGPGSTGASELDQTRRLASEASKSRPERLSKSTLNQAGKVIQRDAEDVYRNADWYSDTFAARLSESLGSTIPVLASAPLGAIPAGAGYAFQAGESAAQEAEQAGKPDSADTAFLANAGLGFLTEAALGVPANILRYARAARQKGVQPSTFGEAVKTAIKPAAREGAQESMEQLGSNVIASDVAKYDPERKALEGVGEAAGIGALTGGALGGAASLSNPTSIATREIIRSEGAKAPLAATALAETQAIFSDKPTTVTESVTQPQETPNEYTAIQNDRPVEVEAATEAFPIQEAAEAGQAQEPLNATEQALPAASPAPESVEVLPPAQAQEPASRTERQPLDDAAVIQELTRRYDRNQLQPGKGIREATALFGRTPEDAQRLVSEATKQFQQRQTSALRQAESVSEIPVSEEERLDREFKEAVDAYKVARITPTTASAARLANTAYRWAKKNAVAGWQRFLTAPGDLPQVVHSDKIRRDGRVKAYDTEVKYTVRDFHNAVRDVYGIGKGREFFFGLDKVPQADIAKMNAALKGEIPMTELDERLQAPLTAMREKIDEMSRYMVENGLVDSDLAAKIEGNLGVYLTRSYKVFDDPEWVKNVPEDVRNRARTFLLTEMQRTNPGATVADADTYLRNMLEDMRQDGMGGMLGKGGRIGSKDLTLFMKRKDIAPEIRAVMGEYSNPVVNFARSMSKMARFIGDQEFLNSVKQKGMGRFLFEDGQNPPGFNTLLASEGSNVMAPLNGLRTSEAIAEAFKQFSQGKERGWLVKAYFGLNAISKTSKTVFSLMTQLRNLNQLYFNALNGHYDLREYNRAAKTIMADIASKGDRGLREYYKHLTTLGIVQDSAQATELRESLKDAGLRDLDYDEFSARTIGKNILRASKKTLIDAPIRVYQMADELGKIVGFENEKARIRRIQPGMNEGVVERMAAERIRNTYPTYSMAPEWLKQFRKQPVVGPFVTFAYETWRTLGHSLRLTMKELHSTNPRERREGAKRLAGQMSVLAGGFGIAALSRALLGITKDEEDDQRRFLPPWSKNSQLMFTGKEPGQLSYINLSYLNPYSYAADPLIAVMANDEKGFDEAMVQALAEFIRPFASEQMLAGALVDIARNKTSTGAQVYNPQADLDSKASDIAKRLFETIEPGTINRLRKRIIPSFTQEQPEFGRKLDPTTEILSEVTGVRGEKFDFKQGVYFKMRQFREDEKDAENIFRKVATSTRAASKDEIAKAYADMEQSRYRVWQGFYQDVQAAKRRGIQTSTLKTMLKDRGFSQDDVQNLMAGRYSPMPITDHTRKLVRENKKELPMVEINTIRRNAPKGY